MRKTTLLLFLSLLSLCIYAQDTTKLVRRTYLWDVTLSMMGVGGTPNIWKTVQKALVDEIKQINEESTEIVIIPFQHKAISSDVKREMATPEGKERLIKFVSEYKLPKLWVGSATSGHEVSSASDKKGTTTMTKLYEPLKYCIDNILKPDKVNILELMTDGMSDFSDDLESFSRLIKDDWCNIAKEKDIYAFYIMLTPQARNDDLFKVKPCRFEVIDVSNGPLSISTVELIPPKRISYNIYDNAEKPVTIRFKRGTATAMPSGYRIKICLTDNPYLYYYDDVEVNSDFSVQFTPKLVMSLDSLNQSIITKGTESITISFAGADGMDSHPYSLVRIREDITEIQLIGAREKRVTLKWK